MKAPTEEIGTLHVDTQKYLINAGLSKTAEIRPEATVAKMSIDRFSKDSGMEKGIFSNKEEAEKWLDG